MKVLGYLRASTKEQDATRAQQDLIDFATSHNLSISSLFIENESGSKLDRPELFKLLEVAERGDLLLVEAIDRLSRLTAEDWKKLRTIIDSKGIKIVALDLPTSYIMLNIADEFTSRMLDAVNGMMLDMLAALARKDYEQRKARTKQGMDNARARGVVFGVPKDPSIDREAIKADVEAGMTRRAIAEKYSVGVSTVNRIANS